MRHNGKYEIDGKLNNHGPALVQTASRRYLSLYTPRVLLVALVTAGVNFIDARTPISGDIGGKIVMGAHGPRRLAVVFLGSG